MDKQLINNDDLERRVLETTQRAEGDESNPIIEGEAAVFNRETVIGGWFRETIAPGAFTRVLSEKPDVVAALNHNWDRILGRTTAGTLKIEESRTGLQYAIDINPEDREAMDTYQKVKRGDVTQASFMFTVRKEEWVLPEDDSEELPLRIIKEVGRLYDVGPCTFGAYPQASAHARSKAAELLQTLASRQEPGAEAAEDKRQASRDLLQRRLDLASK